MKSYKVNARQIAKRNLVSCSMFTVLYCSWIVVCLQGCGLEAVVKGQQGWLPPCTPIGGCRREWVLWLGQPSTASVSHPCILCLSHVHCGHPCFIMFKISSSLYCSWIVVYLQGCGLEAVVKGQQGWLPPCTPIGGCRREWVFVVGPAINCLNVTSLHLVFFSCSLWSPLFVFLLYFNIILFHWMSTYSMQQTSSHQSFCPFSLHTFYAFIVLQFAVCFLPVLYFNLTHLDLIGIAHCAATLSHLIFCVVSSVFNGTIA